GIAKQMRDNDGLGFIGQYRLDCLCSDTEILSHIRQHGSAPTAKMGETTAVQQKVGITTSSPCRTSHARKAISSAKLPEPQRTASSTPSVSITKDLSSLRSGPSMIVPNANDRMTLRYVAPFQ